MTTDVSKHICSVPGPDTIACPICGRMLEGKNYLRHLNNVHKDIDTSQYRRRSESAREKEMRLKKEGKVLKFLFFSDYTYLTSLLISIGDAVPGTHNFFVSDKGREIAPSRHQDSTSNCSEAVQRGAKN